MKKLYFFPIIVLFSFFICSCDKVNSSDDNKDPNVIKGDANALAEVGNTGSFGSIKIGDQYYSNDITMVVTNSENGVATVRLTGDLSKTPELAILDNWIPASYKDGSGKLDFSFKFKSTSEGIQTCMADNSMHTLVKYDCNVGDQYVMKRSNGVTYTRTVTAKSDQNDFHYGFFNIKTITVEQTDTKMVGIKKIIYKINHRYGLVYVEFVAEDGSSLSSLVYSKNENS